MSSMAPCLSALSLRAACSWACSVSKQGEAIAISEGGCMLTSGHGTACSLHAVDMVHAHPVHHAPLSVMPAAGAAAAASWPGTRRRSLIGTGASWMLCTQPLAAHAPTGAAGSEQLRSGWETASSPAQGANLTLLLQNLFPGLNPTLSNLSLLSPGAPHELLVCRSALLC
jgi:hypothetical protein